MERSVHPPALRAVVKQGVVGIGVVALTGAALLAGASAAPAAPITFNPFAVNNGFTVVAQGDAVLGNAELEGSVAAFGSIASGSQNYPVIHQAAGRADYTVPTIDADQTPVRILAGEFVGDGTFDLSNRDDSGTISSTSPEANATARFVDVAGLTGSARSGGTGNAAGQDFLRVTDGAGGILDLKAVPFQGASIEDLLTDEPTVASYFPDLATQVAQVNQCLADMYDPEAGLVNTVTVTQEGGLVYVEGFATDRPNVIDYADIAGQTIKLDRADGYRPTAQAPLVIRVPAGTTALNQLRFEGWSADGDQELARYLMFDLSEVTGEVTIDGVDLGAIWAPDADLVFSSNVSTNGQWFAQDVTTSGGGEIHHHAFAGELVCDGEEPTEDPTTEEPTEDPTTEEPTEDPTTEEPTEDPTTEEPTEDPTTVDPTEDPTTVDPTEDPTTVEPTDDGTEQPDEATEGDLPETGANPVGVLAVAGGLLIAGAMTVLMVRRRTHG